MCDTARKDCAHVFQSPRHVPCWLWRRRRVCRGAWYLRPCPTVELVPNVEVSEQPGVDYLRGETMVGRQPYRSAQRFGPLVFVVTMAIAGCDGPTSTDIPAPITSPSSSTLAPEPTTEIPEPTPSAPDSKAASSQTPEPTTAEAVCEAIYAARGAAPRADSGNIDDEMALFETWHAGLLRRAIEQLGSSAELQDLVAAMEEMRVLSVTAARIYAQHPVFSSELTQIQNRQTALADEVTPIAANAGAPTCASLVVLP